ncbi:MAG: sulfotransferase domain-containing protein, partial [Kiritimatiellae bacterium]|nr:sulfotransferase domain-containing protein [Kiritimatiellia bacterium]
FLGIEVIEGPLQKAVEDTSFEQMKKMELEKKLAEPWLRVGAEKSERGMKVRKGKVGGYKEELSAKDVEFLHKRIAAQLHPDLPYAREAVGPDQRAM